MAIFTMKLSNSQPSGVVVAEHTPSDGRDTKQMDNLRDVRLALSGSLVGIALVGIITGNNHQVSYDLIGAIAGFVAFFTLKFRHIV